MLQILFLILQIVLAIYVGFALALTLILGGINWYEAKRHNWHDQSLAAMLSDSAAVGFSWPVLAVMLLGYFCFGSAPEEEEEED